jgi:hypothetical protein
MIAVPRAIEHRDIPALAEFLVRVYKFDSTDHHANATLLEWKYLWPRSDWQGSRSYVLEKNGQIVAHCGVCPVTFQFSSGAALESITMMDWAADPSVPGIGVGLFRKLMAMSPASFVIGGAPATRRIIPRIGFVQVGEAQTYSGWLRPWREFRTRPSSGRSAVRLLHGMTHPVREVGRLGGDWDFRLVSEFDDSLQPILNGAKRSWTVCKRTLADLNYLLKCPHLKVTAFLLLRQTRIAGYFIVGRSAWEARVLDVSIDSDNVNDWKAGVHTITKAIQLDPEACRIRVQAIVPILSQALAWNGYWRQYSEPIFIHDPSHALDQEFPVAFQLCDGDAGY